MKHRTFYLILGLITLLASLVRLYRLDSVPPSPNRDEAAIGYNAYSILKTGRDEYGQKFPVSIKSFGDYKLPLYLYLTVPMVAIGGLTVSSVRIVSALAGILAVFLTGSLASQLFKNKLAGLASAFILALNPWHVFFSHAGFETNLNLTLLILAFWLYLKARQRPALLPVAYLSFGLSLLTYHGAQPFTPLLVLGLSGCWLKDHLAKKWLGIAMTVFLALGIFAFVFTAQQGGQTKLAAQSILNDPVFRYARIDARRSEHPALDLSRRIFHNRFLLIPYQAGIHYLRHFSTQFLFETGGVTPGQNLIEFGNLLLVEGIFLILGVYFLISERHPALALISLWLFLAPLPGALTKDAPHSARTLALVFPLALIGGYGLGKIFNWAQTGRTGKIGLSSILLLTLINSAMFLESYFYHFSLNRARFWGYDYAGVALNKQIYDQAGKVVLNGQLDYPYIFFLFFNRFDPGRFQQEVVRDKPTADGFVPVKNFAKFEFVQAIDYNQLWQSPDTVFIDRIEHFSILVPDGTVNLPTGEPVMGWYYVPKDPCQKIKIVPVEKRALFCKNTRTD